MQNKKFEQLEYTEVKYSYFKMTERGVSWSFVIAILLAISVVLYNIYNLICNYEDLENLFNVVFVMIIPIIPIIYIWKDMKQRDWEENLKAFLNLKIKNQEDDSVVAFFEAIPVQNGADIRQQAQTLCKELITGGLLKDLELFIRPKKLKESTKSCSDLNGNKDFKIYEVCMYVKKVDRSTGSKASDIIKVEKNKYWYWCPLINDKNSKILPIPSE